MDGLLFVKLGGSLITDKGEEEAERPEVLARLAGELVRGSARGGWGGRLVVGHGSGSFGHVAARRHGIGGGPLGAEAMAGTALTQERAAALHRRVIAALLAAGAAPFSLAPSSLLVADGGQPAELFLEPLLLALSGRPEAPGLLPVVYGDVVMDRAWRAAICSTERLFELLAARLGAMGRGVAGVIWLGETDGVYAADGSTLESLDEESFPAAGAAIGGSRGTDVTGGMRHRVATALRLARLGVSSLIANGATPGLLERCLAGEEVPGTRIAPRPTVP